jgi:ABC-type branched-subunit amino acid transport system ATPase component
MIQVESLAVDLGGHRVLRGVSVNLQAGRTVAIVGRNGAGKTTFLRALMGLVAPAAGRLLLDGVDVTRQAAHRRAAAGFGYAPEDRVILPTLSVRENVTLPCDVQRTGKESIARRLDEVLAIVPQLQPLLARSGAALSGGQGKIVALARALMVGERYVFLDEPFQGLAPALAEQYGNALRGLRASRPTLCVVVTESNGALLDGIQSETLHIERGAISAPPPREERPESELRGHN